MSILGDKDGFNKRFNAKDKFDNSRIDNLCELTDKEIEPIIFNLLEWLQDYIGP